MESIKLQKYFTDCGILSRRAAEQEIAMGNVTVNGAPAHMGQRILPGTDVVCWRGRELAAPTAKNYHYILLHKPRGVLTTMSDDRGRPTVAELVTNVGTRVYPVGRLDMDSEGLLLLTDDGALAMQLTHPRHQIPKIYRVTVGGAISPDQLRSLNEAMTIDGYRILPVKTELLRTDANSSTLRMTLFEGRNRQIRKMCSQVGLRVSRLVRIGIGNITLQKDLPAGAWRHLTQKEIDYLKTPSKAKETSSC